MEQDTADRQLLAALRQHDARAFEDLMRRYNRLLFRAARGIVADDAEAQDAVQEAWLRAFTGLDAFRGEAALGTWLTRIAIRQAIDLVRRRGRLVDWGTGSDAAEESDMADARDPAAVAASPEEAAARAELKRELERAIDTLPPIYRSVFLLRAVEGLSVQDAALALQVSTDVVKTRYLRARSLLRAVLRQDPEAVAQLAHDFEGARCDAMVHGVLARLRATGVIRDH